MADNNNSERTFFQTAKARIVMELQLDKPENPMPDSMLAEQFDRVLARYGLKVVSRTSHHG